MQTCYLYPFTRSVTVILIIFLLLFTPRPKVATVGAIFVPLSLVRPGPEKHPDADRKTPPRPLAGPYRPRCPARGGRRALGGRGGIGRSRAEPPPARRVQEAEAARLRAGCGQVVGSIPVLQEAVENGRAAGAGGDEE